MEGLEKERDFYFGKLRDIEVQCQEEEDAPAGSVIEKIKAILYATEVSAGGLRFNHLATKSSSSKKYEIQVFLWFMNVAKPQNVPVFQAKKL